MIHVPERSFDAIIEISLPRDRARKLAEMVDSPVSAGADAGAHMRELAGRFAASCPEGH